MSFHELLQRVVHEVPGCVNCTLMGFDGIPIDSVDATEVASEVNVGDAHIEYAMMLSQARTAAGGLDAGEVSDLCVQSGKLTSILRPLTEEYLVAASLTPDGLLGKGRYLLRVIAPALRAELE